MPRYEYECRSCGNGFEAHRRISARHRAKCPECGQRGQLLISASAIQTEDNNPYKLMGAMGGFDASTRKAARENMDREGIVIANGRDRDMTARRRSEHRRAEKKEMAEMTAEYATIPRAARQMAVAEGGQ